MTFVVATKLINYFSLFLYYYFIHPCFSLEVRAERGRHNSNVYFLYRRVMSGMAYTLYKIEKGQIEWYQI